MDSFPDEINRQTCMQILEQNQLILIKLVRQKFNDTINHALSQNDKSVTLLFDEKLWDEHCKTITTELLTRFGKFTTTSNPGKYVVTKPLTSAGEIPDNLKSIQIDFYP